MFGRVLERWLGETWVWVGSRPGLSLERTRTFCSQVTGKRLWQRGYPLSLDLHVLTVQSLSTWLMFNADIFWLLRFLSQIPRESMTRLCEFCCVVVYCAIYELGFERQTVSVFQPFLFFIDCYTCTLLDLRLAGALHSSKNKSRYCR